jgi:glucosamine--fructose-6-phosphate aminotransferase (isomerizing)
MCGIVGILSNDNIVELLLCGLKNLQNRGYDSAGICSFHQNEFILDKYASTKDHTALYYLDTVKHRHSPSTLGIAHTRWATHGAKTDTNSHPHISSDDKFVIVHNGIIENFKMLKTKLIEYGYKFKSETDTEVIANLLAYEYSITNDIINAIESATQQMEGTWGLCIMCKEKPNELYCVRNGSPILIGRTKNMVMVVSEQAGFNEDITEYFVLNNHDICVIHQNKTNINVTTQHSYHLKTVTDNNSGDCGEYVHWTKKEIYEQTETALRAISFGGRVLSSNEVKLGGLDYKHNELKGIDNIILLGCGTSYNAGLCARHWFKDLCEFNCVQVFDGAEFELSDIPRRGKTALILLSQSGETKDLHRCIQLAKTRDVFTIGVVNVVDSLIAREVDCGCYLNAGREVGVASTKSFTSQCIVLSMIAIWFAQLHHINIEKRQSYIKDLQLLSTHIGELLDGLETRIEQLLPIFLNRDSCFILGKAQQESIAREASLKVKEISYIHTEAYSSSSLKHGPFALLEKGFPVILLIPNDEHYNKNRNAYHEIQSREANIIVVTDAIDDNDLESENTIYVPQNKTYSAVLTAIPLQMLAYLLAVSKGINPDIPKNLAKVVTVE